MTTGPGCTVPGRRTLHRQTVVGGPPWPIPVSLLIVAAVAGVTGMGALVTAAPELARGIFVGPAQLGAVHLLGLAFLSTTIIGALLQLVPVLLRTPLGPPAWAVTTGASVVTGSWALALGLWGDVPPVIAIGGALVVVGGAMVVGAVTRALWRAWRTGHLGAPGIGIALATGWFAVVIALGALMAANRVHRIAGLDPPRLMAAHGTIAILGWIGGSIIALSLRLAPMFALAHGFRRRTGEAAMIVWHVAVALVAAGLILDVTSLALAGGAVLLVAIALAASFTLDVALHRRRRVEAPMVHLLLGLGAVAVGDVLLMAGWSAGGVSPRVAITAALLTLVGLGCGVTSGYLFKVQPMLVWTGRFAHLAGTPGAPVLADLYPHRLAVAEQALFAVGLVVLAAGVLVGSAGAAVTGAVLLLLACLAVLGALITCVIHRPPVADRATRRIPPAPTLPTA